MSVTSTSKPPGFTLIELLVSMVISALVVSAIYGVYTSMLQTTVNETDIVDVQQELRIVSNYISRDIRMAGVLLPSTDNAVTSATSSASLTLQTASNKYAYAVVASDLDVEAGSSASCTLTVTSGSMLAHFSKNDTVRIIRPQSHERLGSADYTVLSVADTESAIAGTTTATITLNPLGNSDELTIKAGDVIGGVASGAGNPTTISWSLSDKTLQRTSDSNTAEDVLDNVSSLSFEYFDDSGATTTSADDVAAIRITLAMVADRQLKNNARERQLSTLVYLRN